MSLLPAALGALGGALAGSFIATLVLRWPQGEQVMSGRSRCDGCERTLRWWELVPLISALLSRGRCRTCGHTIARTHAVIELTATLLAGTALLLKPDASGVALALFWLLLLPSAWLDARHYWLPDRLTLTLAIAGLAFGSWVSNVGLTDRLIGAVVGGGGLWLIGAAYAKLRGRTGLGTGDPKFLAAIGLWLGWQALPFVLLLAALIGLLFALLLRRGRSDRLPFGSLLAAAAILWSASGDRLLPQLAVS